MKKNRLLVCAICVSLFVLSCNNNTDAAHTGKDTAKKVSDSLPVSTPAEGFPAAPGVDTLRTIGDTPSKDPAHSKQ